MVENKEEKKICLYNIDFNLISNPRNAISKEDKNKIFLMLPSKNTSIFIVMTSVTK
jgi:hypothetical protein